MTDRLPQEFLAALGTQAPEPDIPPAPEFGMSLTQQPQPGMPADPMMGQPQASPGVPPTADPNVPGPPGTEDDPVLTQLLQKPRIKPAQERKPGPKPTIDLVRAIANTQEMRFSVRNNRINRDIALYRQRTSFVPGEFDKRTDTPWVSATLPNIVNKLANMLSAPEPRMMVPFSDEQSKVASQAVENFGYWCRKIAKKYYARSGGGNLQWDEFFYLLLHGQLIARVLPDTDDEDYPFYFSLVDPAQCYPVFKGDKHGLQMMIRKYSSTANDIINTYCEDDPAKERAMARAMGYSDGMMMDDFLNQEGDTVEYWDKDYRAVLWRDIPVLDVTATGYGFVPFVVVSARGEPKSMSTPFAGGSGYIDEYGNTGYGPSREEDLSQKGVSVFHHLVQTNRLSEVIHTLLLMDVEKALNPPTITYVAPQYLGQDPPPLNLRKRGNNKRVLNFMKVEAVPTSPRPTDMSPLLNKAAMDVAEGSLPPVAHGNESGSNVSGFAVESLIAVAKDATLPYTQAFEVYLAQVVEMKLRHYQKFILPIRTISVPARRSYGQTPMSELTEEVLDLAGIDVEVKLWAMSQQMLPGQIQAAAMAVQAGIWPLRKAMEHTGSLDPDRDFQDIISEHAIQHPEIMENFLIPMAFKSKGQDDLAELWQMLVVMPKMQAAMMGGAMPGSGPPPPTGGGGGPQPNGQSNPTMTGKAKSTGGGPAAGQGRGPAGNT